MAERTVAAHLSETHVDRLAALAESEGRSTSQLIAAATKIMLELSPGARRSLLALEGASEPERDFAMKMLGRAAMRARERIISSRIPNDYVPVTNRSLDTDEAIEAEAVAACRM